MENYIRDFGVTEFPVGKYGDFDRLAAKARHSDITLTMLLPYHPSERAVQLPDGFDDTCYPLGQETAPRQLAIVRANRYMVDHSDYLIAYVWHAASNARNLLEYAKKELYRASCTSALLDIENEMYGRKKYEPGKRPQHNS